jgi:hypothetical protein
MQSGEEDGGVSFSDIGGLNEQIRELREVIELPLTNPELFIRVGIKVFVLFVVFLKQRFLVVVILIIVKGVFQVPYFSKRFNLKQKIII